MTWPSDLPRSQGREEVLLAYAQLAPGHVLQAPLAPYEGSLQACPYVPRDTAGGPVSFTVVLKPVYRDINTVAALAFARSSR